MSDPACRRCSAALQPDAIYCHVCGVAVAAAATGEYEIYDLERFFNYALDMLCIAGTDGYFKRVNPAFSRILGYSPEELLAEPFSHFVHPDDRFDTVAETGRLSDGQLTLSFENRYRCRDGSYRDISWTAYPEPGTGLIYAVARDVTEQRRRQDQLDALTGLASMRAFEETLPQEWSRARRLGTPLTLALFDLDRFEQFNEACGFETGDRFLAGVGGVLAGHARRVGDLAARVTGQKFAQVLQGRFTPTEAVSFCDAVRQAVADLILPHTGTEPLPRVTVSVGVAVMIPRGPATHRDLLAAAEAALAQAKSRGGDCVVQAPITG
ncbi:MAG TPA: diguanylate cyclase [Gemmatimonadales bacterium]|nr:diguanylate cyclase [Gemmatimonadales bacterium]